MKSFNIKRTDHSDLEFEGELLGRVNTPHHATPDGSRGYELAIYAKSGGGYVASVEYLSTVPPEVPVASADFVERAKDVENFFLVVEPCEFLSQDLLRQMPDDQRQRLQKALCQIYDGHLDIILKTVQEYASRHPEHDIDEASEKESRPKSRLLGLFGLE